MFRFGIERFCRVTACESAPVEKIIFKSSDTQHFIHLSALYRHILVFILNMPEISEWRQSPFLHLCSHLLPAPPRSPSLFHCSRRSVIPTIQSRNLGLYKFFADAPVESMLHISIEGCSYGRIQFSFDSLPWYSLARFTNANWTKFQQWSFRFSYGWLQMRVSSEVPSRRCLWYLEFAAWHRRLPRLDGMQRQAPWQCDNCAFVLYMIVL